MKRLIFVALILFLGYAGHSWAKMGFDLSMSLGGNEAVAPVSEDFILWDATTDVILWDASGDKIYWE